MFAHNRLGVITIVLACSILIGAGFATGIALGEPMICDGHYCNPNLSGCIPTGQFVSDLCCKDFDGDGVFHCVQCTREYYDCPAGLVLGQPFNCGGARSVCQ